MRLIYITFFFNNAKSFITRSPFQISPVHSTRLWYVCLHSFFRCTSVYLCNFFRNKFEQPRYFSPSPIMEKSIGLIFNMKVICDQGSTKFSAACRRSICCLQRAPTKETKHASVHLNNLIGYKRVRSAKVFEAPKYVFGSPANWF